MAKSKILVVDDGEINRSLLADILEEDYEVLEAVNGVEALDRLGNIPDIALVLLDIVMPEMDGFQVLEHMKVNGWLEHIPVLMISAEAGSDYVDRAYDLGATDYIIRPFDERVVTHRVRNTIMLYTKQHELEEMIVSQVAEREQSNAQMVEILSNIVEFRNGESGAHVRHIRVITELILDNLRRRHPELELTASRIALISNASAMHDIGKISIPDAVLNKPGRLTDEEFAIMKTHAAAGAEILSEALKQSDSELLRMAHDVCRWHHERYDGRGYPDGLKGDEIPLAAQVVALADVYDALTSVRVYKPAIPPEKALQMIFNGECGAFNPMLMDTLREVEGELKRDLDEIKSDTKIREITSEIFRRGGMRLSDRSFALLQQERKRFEFYASMSKEILFEYDWETDIMTISEWGARYLDLPELIQDPRHNAVLSAITSEFAPDIIARLSATTPEEPNVSASYHLMVDGKARWFKAEACALWDAENTEHLPRAIGKLTDIHEEHQRLSELRRLADQDSLTGLYNRRAARGIIETMMKEPEEGMRFAFLLIDLDYFKHVNDTYGHATGDSVLKFVAQNMRHSIRGNDVAARIGGDEFMIVLAYRGDVEPILARIYAALTRPHKGLPISISMGVSLCPEHGAEFDDLLGKADRALYAVKEAGRGSYRIFDETVPEAIGVRTAVDSEHENDDEII